MTVEALKEFGLSRKDAERAKNMFALGLLSWLYDRPDRGHRSRSCETQVRQASPTSSTANITAFQAGWNFGETTEDFAVRYEVKPAPMPPGTYRNITGNLALAYGLVAAGARSPGCRCSSAPTRSPRPRDILHELSKHKRFGVTHVPGRGRDRRHRRGARRVVRRRARRHHHVRARASR